MRRLLVVALAVAVLFASVSGFSVGAPRRGCRTMIPGHGTKRPQAGNSTVQIYVSKSVYTPGGNLTGNTYSQ